MLPISIPHTITSILLAPTVQTRHLRPQRTPQALAKRSFESRNSGQIKNQTGKELLYGVYCVCKDNGRTPHQRFCSSPLHVTTSTATRTGLQQEAGTSLQLEAGYCTKDHETGLTFLGEDFLVLGYQVCTALKEHKTKTCTNRSTTGCSSAREHNTRKQTKANEKKKK